MPSFADQPWIRHTLTPINMELDRGSLRKMVLQDPPFSCSMLMGGRVSDPTLLAELKTQADLGV